MKIRTVKDTNGKESLEFTLTILCRKCHVPNNVEDSAITGFNKKVSCRNCGNVIYG